MASASQQYSSNPLHPSAQHHDRHASRDAHAQAQGQSQRPQGRIQQPSALVHSNSKLKHKQSQSRGQPAAQGDQDLLRDNAYSRAAPNNGNLRAEDGEGSQKKKGFWSKLIGVITCSTCRR